MDWIAAFVAIWGVLLNMRKNKWSFFLWMLSNGYFTAQSFIVADYAKSALFAVNFILSVVGYYMWARVNSVTQLQW